MPLLNRSWRIRQRPGDGVNNNNNDDSGDVGYGAPVTALEADARKVIGVHTHDNEQSLRFIHDLDDGENNDIEGVGKLQRINEDYESREVEKAGAYCRRQQPKHQHLEQQSQPSMNPPMDLHASLDAMDILENQPLPSSLTLDDNFVDEEEGADFSSRLSEDGNDCDVFNKPFSFNNSTGIFGNESSNFLADDEHEHGRNTSNNDDGNSGGENEYSGDNDNATCVSQKYFEALAQQSSLYDSQELGKGIHLDAVAESLFPELLMSPEGRIAGKKRLSMPGGDKTAIAKPKLSSSIKSLQSPQPTAKSKSRLIRFTESIVIPSTTKYGAYYSDDADSTIEDDIINEESLNIFGATDSSFSSCRDAFNDEDNTSVLSDEDSVVQAKKDEAKKIMRSAMYSAATVGVVYGLGYVAGKVMNMMNRGKSADEAAGNIVQEGGEQVATQTTTTTSDAATHLASEVTSDAVVQGAEQAVMNASMSTSSSNTSIAGAVPVNPGMTGQE